MNSKIIMLTAATLGLMNLPALAQKEAAPDASPPQQHESGMVSNLFNKEEKVQWSVVPVAVQKTITVNAQD